MTCPGERILTDWQPGEGLNTGFQTDKPNHKQVKGPLRDHPQEIDLYFLSHSNDLIKLGTDKIKREITESIFKKYIHQKPPNLELSSLYNYEPKYTSILYNKQPIPTTLL